MKAYKVELLIIDFDELGKEQIVEELVNANFPNDCITINVKNIVEKDIGEWHDDHPLNIRIYADAEYQKIFGIIKT
jgi:hypothetical protein